MEVEDCDTDGSFLEAVQPASKRIAALVQKRPKIELFIIQSPLIPNKIITSVVGVLQNFVIIVADKGRIDWQDMNRQGRKQGLKITGARIFFFLPQKHLR